MARPREASKGAGTLVLINSTSFSAASSISLNNCFSSTYDNYRIILKIDSGSVAGNAVSLRLRSSGSDNTSNIYYSARQFNFAYNTGHFGAATNPGTQTTDFVFSDTTSSGGILTLDIASPFETKMTKGKVTSMGIYVNLHGGFLHESASSFDGISFLVNTGNITGTVQVYGYRK